MSKLLRCAIYTRKSSEEGLEQSFNSLHAQREACEAYIKSQQHEGWRLVRTKYDDGGFSGGNMQRPGLQQLLADIDRGVVDAVLVYKVDRLTRALGDFARIVDRLDAKKVSFVSVTQAFNTTTSMGRLTLNMLLSFAQFDREVTSERIRDKIAASKAKGMWMGGTPPLGYRPEGRRLVVVPAEADLVRRLFQRYLDLRSLTKLERELAAEGILTHAYVAGQGRCGASSPFQAGPLLHILRNPVSVGEIRHKGVQYPGEHEPIVDRGLWEAVQFALNGNREQREQAPARDPRAMLRGLVRGADGVAMMIKETAKPNGRRYSYYISSPTEGPQLKVSAPQLDAAVEKAIVERMTPAAAKIYAATAAGHRKRQMRAIVRRVEVMSDAIALTIDTHRLNAKDTGAPRKRGRPRKTDPSPFETIVLPMKVGAVSACAELQSPEGVVLAPDREPDRPLITAMAEAHRWRWQIEAGQVTSIAALAESAGLDLEAFERRLALAYLAPDLTRDIVLGRRSQASDLASLTNLPLPLSWEQQQQVLAVRPA